MKLISHFYQAIWINLYSLSISLIRWHLFLISNIFLELIDTTSFHLFTWKRLFILISCYYIITGLMIWNHLGFFFDDLIFQEYKHIDICNPLFIIGNARSGTTQLHRILAQSNLFTSMKTWEIFFASSISWRYLFYISYDIDRIYLNSFFFNQILSPLEHWLMNLSAIHRIGLFQYEEDEWAMLHIFCCQLSLLVFPLGLHLPSQLSIIPLLTSYDTTTTNSLSSEMKVFIFEYYKKLIQRHLYFHMHRVKNSKLIFLSKNPTFTLRLRSLIKAFPLAKVICMIRDPIDSIPSMISYISHVWNIFTIPKVKYPKFQLLVEFCIQHYMFPIRKLPFKILLHIFKPLHSH